MSTLPKMAPEAPAPAPVNAPATETKPEVAAPVQPAAAEPKKV